MLQSIGAVLNKNFKIAVFLIIAFAFLLRFYNLSDIPAGLNQDELSIGYDAYSILLTGRDQHAKPYPLYFESYGDYKLPVYIYATAVSEKIFGVNEFAVRFFSAIMGSLSVIFLFLLTKKITNSNNIALIASTLLAINPWHLYFSRTAFEVNVASAFILIGVYFLYLSIEKKLGTLFLLLSILSIIISVYTYNVTRIAAPLTFLMFVFFLRKEFFKKFNKKIIFAFIILFLVLLSPFLITLLNSSGLQAQKSVLIFGGDSLAKTIQFRAIVNSFPEIFVKLFFNKLTLIGMEYFKNLAGSFNSYFFFVSGDPTGAVGLVNMGMFHFFEFITIIVGVAEIIRRKIKEFYPILGWFLIGVFVVSISAIVPRATRSFIEVIPLAMISGFGLFVIVRELTRVKFSVIHYGGLIAVWGIVIYSAIYLIFSYFIVFPTYYGRSYRPQEKVLAEYFKENDSKYTSFVIDKNYDIIYSSIIFYNKYPPHLFHTDARWDVDKGSGFRTVNEFGKYKFSKISWPEEVIKPNALLVMPLGFGSSKFKPIHEIKGRSIPVAIPMDGGISTSIYDNPYYNIYSTNDCYREIRNKFKFPLNEDDKKLAREICS
jgi:4-amino-4-deoxy-L-arabinose transferase-like glycosyltransferase